MQGESSAIAAGSLQSALAQKELQLRSAKDAAYDQVCRRPTIKNRKEYESAEKELSEFLRDLQESEPGEPIFTGVLDVLNYLDAEEWKVGKSKLYDDFTAGKLESQPDGSFLLGDVLRYARVHLKKKDGTPGAAAGVPSLQEQKILEEVGRIRADRLQRELKYKETVGELIKKSDVEIELAKRAAYLRSDLKTVFRAGSVEIIKRVGGDPQKAAALIAFGVKLVDEAMDRYARPVKGFEDEA